jgi:uncharacterized protein (DUF362 family)
MVNMDRRSFVKTGLASGAVGIMGRAAIGRALAAAAAHPDIVAVKGTDAFASTDKALQALGGIGRFVSKGSRVGLLINAPVTWWLEGSHTRMEIPLAVAKLCFDAGAKEVVSLPVLSPKYWTDSPLAKVHASVASSIRSCSGRTVDTKIPDGIHLKSAKLRVELLDVDVLVNIPVAKHHTGTILSGNLKNMMGGADRETNRTFHVGADGYGDLDLLCQCIADLNTVRKPSLCVADATVVLATNGPAGPGDILKPQKVVVGIDPVAVDAYCAKLHQRNPKEILLLNKAVTAGLGRFDIEKLVVRELRGA